VRGILVLLLVGCASVPPGEQGRADRAAESLARLVRLHYEQRLAVATPHDPTTSPPAPSELQRANDALKADLSALSLSTPDSDRLPLGDAIALTRNVLLASDYVFLPTDERLRDPGLSLAKVTARTKGLSREFWGHTLRYRRVEHDGVLLPDYASYVAVRAGQGALPPAGRFAGPTVYLDRRVIRRRAGRFPYGGLSPPELSEFVELGQAALMLLSKEIKPEELLDPKDRARELTRLHGRVLVTLLRYGRVEVTLAVLEALLRPGQQSSPERVAAAKRIHTALGPAPQTLSQSALRKRAAELYEGF
jgi:hypothetical protein